MQNRALDSRDKTKISLSEKHSKRQTGEARAQSPIAPIHGSPSQITCRSDDVSCASAHVSILNLSSVLPLSATEHLMLQMQYRYGNRNVQQVLALVRKGQAEEIAAEDGKRDIHRTRGGGRTLDSIVRASMESAFSADFSGVRVHTGPKADELNRLLNARAFTTGQNIYFRNGEYNPRSSSGRELLAHELTHVIQQKGPQIQRNPTIGQPGDRYEQEADQVAKAIMQEEQQTIVSESDEGLVPKSQNNNQVQGILSSGNNARAGIVQRTVIRNDVVDYMFVPDRRLPHGIVVDLNFLNEASQSQISSDLIIALRRWVMTQEEDRSPGLVNAPAFQNQLRLYLDGYRQRNRPSIRGEWDYRIYIQLNRNVDPTTGYRVDSIAIDTRRHPPIPQPRRPEGPSREEREGWIERTIRDRDVEQNFRRMLILHREGHLDGLYQLGPRVDVLVTDSTLTPLAVTQHAADANDDITNAVNHALDYEAFKGLIIDIRTSLMNGIGRIHFHDSEGAHITTLDHNAEMIHEWVWNRQPNTNSVYGIFYPQCDHRGFRT